MTIGTVLVSKDGYYVGTEGQLPTGRPEGDKQFITDLICGEKVLCSPATLEGLPKSMLGIAKFVHSGDDWDINFGIGTFKTACDLFIVVHATGRLGGGKKFKYEYLYKIYNRIMHLNNISIYVKK